MSLMKLLDRVRGELPNCDMASVVNAQSGLALAASMNAAASDGAAADAFTSQLVRDLAEAANDAGVDGTPEDVVLQGASRIMVLQPLDGSGFYWLVSTAATTTLGFTQAVMRKYRDAIAAEVSELI